MQEITAEVAETPRQNCAYHPDRYLSVHKIDLIFFSLAFCLILSKINNSSGLQKRNPAALVFVVTSVSWRGLASSAEDRPILITLCAKAEAKGVPSLPSEGAWCRPAAPTPGKGAASTTQPCCVHREQPSLWFSLPSDLSTSVSLALRKINRRGYSTPTRAQKGSDSCHWTQTYKTLSFTCVMEADAFYLQAVSFSW